MLMRFDPFRELDRLSQQALGTVQNRTPVMPMDAYRRGEEFVVEFDLPGVDPQSIELTVEKNVLSVRAARQREDRQGDDLIVSERLAGTFTRQLFLGETLDTDNIRASYDLGVLTLTIPVAERAKPRKVEINSTDSRRTIEPAESAAST